MNSAIGFHSREIGDIHRMHWLEDGLYGPPVSSVAVASKPACSDMTRMEDAVNGTAAPHPQFARVNAQAAGRSNARSLASLDCYADLLGSLEKCALLAEAL